MLAVLAVFISKRVKIGESFLALFMFERGEEMEGEMLAMCVLASWLAVATTSAQLRSQTGVCSLRCHWLFLDLENSCWKAQ